jgi:hypothetical protein
MGYLFARRVLKPKPVSTINIKYMKNLLKMTVLAGAALTLTFTACDSKPAENAENATEETMDAAGAELDSATTPTEGDTAVVRDQPTEGVVDSMEQK